MENQADVVVTQSFSVVLSNLEIARNGVVKVMGKSGEVIKVYADVMCSTFNILSTAGELVTPWYELKGKQRAGVKAERALFVSLCELGGHKTGTIDVMWQRVKEASGYVTSGNRVKGNNGVDDKTKAELFTMINRIFKAEEEGDSSAELSSENKGKLMDIYANLGGDIDKLG
jgi:hypothetical protein